VSYLRKFNLIF